MRLHGAPINTLLQFGEPLTGPSDALCQVPFVSLDAPWCFDYGLRSGVNWAFPLVAEDGTVQNNHFWC